MHSVDIVHGIITLGYGFRSAKALKSGRAPMN
jgi:hypothetical protein